LLAIIECRAPQKKTKRQFRCQSSLGKILRKPSGQNDTLQDRTRLLSQLGGYRAEASLYIGWRSTDLDYCRLYEWTSRARLETGAISWGLHELLLPVAPGANLGCFNPLSGSGFRSHSLRVWGQKAKSRLSPCEQWAANLRLHNPFGR
jgi:hypothetical protein